MALLVLLAVLTAGMGPVPPTSEHKAQYSLRSADPNVHRAAQLLNTGRPLEALGILEEVVEHSPQDPNILQLVGLAAFRADEVSQALNYWQQAIRLRPNPALLAMFDDADREIRTDLSHEKLLSHHIALRYESGALSADDAQSVLNMLERNYSRISNELGCTTSEHIVTVVQSAQQYRLAASGTEWTGGHYDGRIHLAWSSGQANAPAMERAAAHELVHACLSNLPSGSAPWPNWLEEGLAQKLSGDTLQPAVRQQLSRRAAAHQIPRLENLDEDWFGMSRQDAEDAYNLSLAAVVALDNRVRDILTQPDRIVTVTSQLDSTLGL